jgi:hypothetical protein
MHSLGRVKLLGSFLRPRFVHLHRLATAGAMLTCVAVILNVGPFAKAPKIDSLHDNAIGEAARPITEQSVAPTSTSRLKIDAPTQPDQLRWAMGPADVPEPIRPSIEPAFSSIVEVPQSASQSATPKEADDKIQAEPPPHLAAAVPAVLPPADHAGPDLIKNATPMEADDRIQAEPLPHLAAAVPAVPPPADRADPDLMKKVTIVGVWAPDAGNCSARNFRAGVLPAVINAEGAWAGETFCAFKNQKQTETGWRVVAKCSNPRERWTVNVRLTVQDNRLTWTSKRGTQTYTRCPPDVLMAAAR